MPKSEGEPYCGRSGRAEDCEKPLLPPEQIPDPDGRTWVGELGGELLGLGGTGVDGGGPDVERVESGSRGGRAHRGSEWSASGTPGASGLLEAVGRQLGSCWRRKTAREMRLWSMKERIFIQLNRQQMDSEATEELVEPSCNNKQRRGWSTMPHDGAPDLLEGDPLLDSGLVLPARKSLQAERRSSMLTAEEGPEGLHLAPRFHQSETPSISNFDKCPQPYPQAQGGQSQKSNSDFGASRAPPEACEIRRRRGSAGRRGGRRRALRKQDMMRFEDDTMGYEKSLLGNLHQWMGN
uniref:Uncharacterized protein n=1 Tax=Steinernema glaseri TaxID=37863 RepID=A0A1I7ZI68_9BILA